MSLLLFARVTTSPALEMHDDTIKSTFTTAGEIKNREKNKLYFKFSCLSCCQCISDLQKKVQLEKCINQKIIKKEMKSALHLIVVVVDVVQHYHYDYDLNVVYKHFILK